MNSKQDIADQPRLSRVLSDFIFINSGVWILLIPFVAMRFLPEQKYLIVFATLSLLLAIPHTIAPFILFFDQNYLNHLKPEVQSKGFKFLGMWFILGTILTSLALFFYKSDVMNYMYVLVILAALQFFWNFYHFGMQHYGILGIHFRRVSHPSIKIISKIEKIFCLHSVTLTLLITLLHLLKHNSSLHQVISPRILIDIPFVESAIPLAIWVEFSLGMALIFFSRRDPARCAYILTIAIQPIIAHYLLKEYSIFSFSITHWIAEIFLISKIKSSLIENHPTRFFKVRFKYAAFLIMFGAALTLSLRAVIEKLNLSSIDASLSFLPNQLNLEYHSFVIVLIMSLYWWTATGHFYLDKVVYSTRSYKDPNF